jgi:hypothetical protein
VALHSHSLESITSIDEFLRVVDRIVRLNETDGNSSRYGTILESFSRVHLQLKYGSGAIVSNALDQPIAEDDARCTLGAAQPSGCNPT